MIVSFPFTFSFSVPGLPNPFSPAYAQSTSPTSSGNTADPEPASQAVNANKEPTMSAAGGRLASSPAPSISSATSRPTKSLKRGWEPAFAETTPSSTTLVSTRGYLDPPYKYTAMDAPDMHEEGAYRSFRLGPGLGFVFHYALCLAWCAPMHNTRVGFALLKPSAD
ncbi:hypothetical protein NP233_g10675 [Leucocoprinus birnbaumii]|uniref:Uncharacterized protein n=1 Tax=Leucocoprinus birnbaumii TaxID=56174 RepID=A0AAD5YLY2_9AGAR|nr:hypothetical protein NP233_g10675 [Leucocoprinus birnbaumii]